MTDDPQARRIHELTQELEQERATSRLLSAQTLRQAATIAHQRNVIVLVRDAVSLGDPPLIVEHTV